MSLLHETRRGRDTTHSLVITEIDAEQGEWDMEITHGHDCDLVEHEGIGGAFSDFDCPTGRHVNWSGFEDFPRPEELGAGEHRFHLWWSGPDYLGEYDGGIEIEPEPQEGAA